MTTVSEIAREAFDAVAEEMPEVIQSATLTRTGKGGDYDPETGTFPGATETFAGRALFGGQAALADRFPAYVIGSSDRLVYLEGFTTVPREGDAVTIGGKTFAILKVSDIVGVGSFFEAVVR